MAKSRRIEDKTEKERTKQSPKPRKTVLYLCVST